MDHAELASLIDSFTRHLRGARKIAETVRTYGNGVRAFLAGVPVGVVRPAA